MTRKGYYLAAPLVALLAITMLMGAGVSGKPQINTIGSPGLAIKGDDPVAYFDQGGPRAGMAKHTLQHAGVQWRFSELWVKLVFGRFESWRCIWLV